MAIILGIRQTGTLPTTQGTLYQPTSNQSGAFTITVTNTGSSDAKVDLWLKDGSAASRKIRKEMVLEAGDSHSTCKYTLGPGDSFEGKSNSTLIDYVVEGLLKT